MSDPLAAARRTIENAAKATKEPWGPCSSTSAFPKGIQSNCGSCQLICEIATAWHGLPFVNGTPEGNRTFISHVRTDAPLIAQALLDATEENRRLKARVERLEKALKDAIEFMLPRSPYRNGQHTAFVDELVAALGDKP